MRAVAVNISNITKCLCPVCQVQTGSACVTEKRSGGWEELRAQVVGGILEEYPEHPETYEMRIDDLREHPVGIARGAERLTEDAMIELYCAVGKSSCRDLATSNACLCPDCAVWQGHGLESRYYCERAGEAEREG